VLENLSRPFVQHIQRNSELRLAASVRDRLEQQITGAPRSSAANCVVMFAKQQVCVGISYASTMPVQSHENRTDRLHRVRSWIYAKHRVSAAVKQPFEGG